MLSKREVQRASEGILDHAELDKWGRCVTIETAEAIWIAVYAPQTAVKDQSKAEEKMTARVAFQNALVHHIRKVVEDAGDKPVILAGDLNVTAANDDVVGPTGKKRLSRAGIDISRKEPTCPAEHLGFGRM